MRKIELQEKPKRQGKRILVKILAAAAAISVLTITAAAAEGIFGVGDWFRDIFSAKGNGGDLESQVAYVDQIGKVYQESLTSEGTTVTPLAAYGDENICYLRLKVAGPEGTVLPDDIRYAFYGDWDQALTILENPDLYEGLWVLPDGDPTDHEKEFLVKVMAMPEAEQKLNDGSPVPYHIYGLYEVLPYEEGQPEFRQILPGEFTLDLSVCNQVQQTELDVEGVSYYREEVGIQHHMDGTREEIPFDYTVTFRQMQISPLSFSWVCDYEMSDPDWKVGVDVQVVMKDGTQAAIDWGRGSGFGEGHHFAATRQNAFFSVPIDLKDVDHILIGGEQKVYIPAE